MLAPGKVDIIWFSSRCDPFSPANTRGTRNIQEGLSLVEKGINIARYLQPRASFTEIHRSTNHGLTYNIPEKYRQLHLVLGCSPFQVFWAK